MSGNLPPFLKPWRLQSRGLVAVVAVLVVLVVLVAVGIYLVLKPSDQAQPSVAIACNPQYTITHSSIIPVDGGIYQMQTNEYNSNAPFAMCGDGGTDFKITQSQIGVTYDTPGGYPSIYRGCHWGDCTKDSGLPIQVSSLEKDTSQVRLSYDTQVSARGVWDDAFDIFFTPCNDHGESAKRLHPEYAACPGDDDMAKPLRTGHPRRKFHCGYHRRSQFQSLAGWPDHVVRDKLAQPDQPARTEPCLGRLHQGCG